MQAATSSSSTGRFIPGEDVLFFHPKHASWLLGKVKALAAASASPPRARIGQTSVPSVCYQVEACDSLMNVMNDTVNSVAEKDMEPWDLHSGRSVSTLDDLLSLTHLHEGSILRTLAERYFLDLIYTNIGQILVAVNPFNASIPRYLPAQVQGYLKESGKMIATSQQGSSSSTLVPHVWVQAHNTFVTMSQDQQNQSILISGESGAGKTEAAKAVLRYLTMIANVEGAEDDRRAAEQIAAQVMATNPILEAFGNAKTVRNNNSSRFGKLLRLRFRKDVPPALFQSAHTTSYLLEKSRVLTCGPGERTYHAFYLAFQAPDAYREQTLKFPTCPVSNRSAGSASYRTLAAGKVFDNEEYSNEKDYAMVTDALRLVLDSPDAVDAVWRIVSGILNLSNVVMASQGEGSCVEEKSKSFLSTAITLLLHGNTAADETARNMLIPLLEEELTTTQLVIQGTATKKLLPLHKANDTRDALCRGLYNALFDHLVTKCNQRCERANTATSSSSAVLEILLLDIFGFESFVVNSFEQLCINYTNETLQQHYNHAVFTKDVELCAAEGVLLTGITCPDLTPTLQAVHAVFSALDDACSVNGTETQFVESVWKEIPRFDSSLCRNPTQRDSFAVKHYAGDVTYAVTGWIEKNRDTLKPSLRTLFAQVASDCSVDSTSGAALVSSLLNPPSTEGSGESAEAASAPARGKSKKGPVTVSAFFKRQMLELMEVINATVPHWIRCIKPHMEKKPRMLHGEYTLRQLRCSGVLDTVKVRKAGYPVRFLHDAFLRAFRALHVQHGGSVESLISSSDSGPACKQLLAQLGLLTAAAADTMPPAQLGRTMVFLKTDAFFALEQHRKAALNSLILIVQQCGRGMLRRIRVMQTKHAMFIQKVGRRYLAHKFLGRTWAEVHAEVLAEKRRVEEARRREAQAAEKKRLLEQSARQKALTAQFAQDFEKLLRDEIDHRVQVEASEAAERRTELVGRGLGAIQAAKVRQKLFDAANKLIVERGRTSGYLLAEEVEERAAISQQFLRLHRVLFYRQLLQQLQDEETAARLLIEREARDQAAPLDLDHQRILGEFLLNKHRAERERRLAHLLHPRQQPSMGGRATSHHDAALMTIDAMSPTRHSPSFHTQMQQQQQHGFPKTSTIAEGMRVLVRSAAQIAPPTSVLSLRQSICPSVYIGAGTVVHVMPRSGGKKGGTLSAVAVAVRLDTTREVRWFDGDDLDVSSV